MKTQRQRTSEKAMAAAAADPRMQLHRAVTHLEAAAAILAVPTLDWDGAWQTKIQLQGVAASVRLRLRQLEKEANNA